MNLIPQQVTELLEMIDRNQALVLGREFGIEYLTSYELQLLNDVGIDLETLYSFQNDTIYKSFHFGLLADSLAELSLAKTLQYKDLYQYIKSGKYIPLTEVEKATIQSVKNQSLASLRGVKTKIFQDVYGILNFPTREAQEQFIKKEVARGVEYKKTTRQIANEIAHKTGDWSRDFDRIVQYMSQSAYEHGKAAKLEREHGEDAYVYKTVYYGACKHCIRLYLTNGLGSEPKVFKLSELKANGSNIGRKVADWLPTLDPLHPYCRCTLMFISGQKNFVWNKDKQSFEYTVTPVSSEKRARPKVRAVVGGKEVWV